MQATMLRLPKLAMLGLSIRIRHYIILLKISHRLYCSPHQDAKGRPRQSEFPVYLNALTGPRPVRMI